MLRRAIVAFLGSVLGAGVGLGLLWAAFHYFYGGSIDEASATMNIVVSLHILAALTLAAAIWGGVIGGLRMSVRGAMVCFEALVISGLVAFARLMGGLALCPQPDLLAFWPLTTVVATISAAIGGAYMGWRLAGRRQLWWAAMVGALPTGFIFGVPLTTALLMYTQTVTLVLLFLPFVIIATYLGVVIPPAPPRNQEPQQQELAQPS